MPGRLDPTVSLCVGLIGAALLGSCGGVGTPAPPDPPEEVSSCRSLEASLPNFFRLLRDPSSPLGGLEHVVSKLASGDPSDVSQNPIASMLKNTMTGLRRFTLDPDETPDARCVPFAELESRSPEPRPLCGVEAAPGESCENRMCVVRRALSLGLRNEGAKASLDALEPVLGKVLGYISNTGPGADGREHYEALEVLHRTALNESLCAPKNLVDVADGIIVFFRNSPSCGADCAGIRAVESLQAMVADPALQALLTSYEDAEADGKGRGSFQALGRVLGQSLETMPENERYFDSVQGVVDLLYRFMDTDKAKYGALRGHVEEVVSVARALLDPNRPGAILKPLKAVMRCVNQVDSEQALVGAAYDLLSRSGEDGGNGLDVEVLVGTVADVVRLDEHGVFAGALHAILATLSQDEQSLEAVRQFLVQVQTVDNARLAFPALQRMVQENVVDELLGLVDELLYGCRERT